MHKPHFLIEHKSRITGEWRQSLQFNPITKARTVAGALLKFARLLRSLKLPTDDFRLRRVDQAHR